MATASCQNPDCERENKWTLQKAPSNYAGSGPTCPDCGSTNLDIEGEGSGQGDEIQRREADGAAPPTTGGGAAVADIFALADSEAPNQRRAQAAQNVLGTAGGVIKQFMQYQEQKEQARQRRAETVSLERADLPACQECDYQFAGQDIPLDSDMVRCPECKSVYNLRA